MQVNKTIMFNWFLWRRRTTQTKINVFFLILIEIFNVN